METRPNFEQCRVVGSTCLDDFIQLGRLVGRERRVYELVGGNSEGSSRREKCFQLHSPPSVENECRALDNWHHHRRIDTCAPLIVGREYKEMASQSERHPLIEEPPHEGVERNAANTSGI